MISWNFHVITPFLRSSRTCPSFKSCKWSLGGQVNLWSVFGHWGTCLLSISWKFEPNWPIVHWVMTIFVRGAPIFPLLLVAFHIVVCQPADSNEWLANRLHLQVSDFVWFFSLFYMMVRIYFSFSWSSSKSI